MMAGLRRRLAAAGRDRGSAAIELIGFAVMLTLAACLCVQGLYVSQIGAAAENAARDGARAASLGGNASDVTSAVHRQLPSWAHVEALRAGPDAKATCSGSCVQVELRVPIGLPGITSSSITVARTAELPRG
jgi:hypothetical protein